MPAAAFRSQDGLRFGNALPDIIEETTAIPPFGMDGILTLPPYANGVVVVADGAGVGRFSQSARQISSTLVQAGYGTLRFDLLTPAECGDRLIYLDMHLLSHRISQAVFWARARIERKMLNIGLFAFRGCATAALLTASQLPGDIKAVVACGSPLFLPLETSRSIRAPTLFVVGGSDLAGMRQTRLVMAQIECKAALRVIPEAGPLFQEYGALEGATDAAVFWFKQNLGVRVFH